MDGPTAGAAAHKVISFKGSDFVSHRIQTGNGPGGETRDHQEDLFDQRYKILELLGRGRHCTIFRCRARDSGTIRAVKIWRKARRRRRRSLEATRPLVDFVDVDLNDELEQRNPELAEFYCMRDLSHPNIAAIYELVEAPTHYYMVMEYSGGGTLQADLKLKPGERYPEDKAGSILNVLLSSVVYLHSSKENRAGGLVDKKTILHCDLNLSNILLDENKEKTGLIKLIDFGDALVLDKEPPKDRRLLAEHDEFDWLEPRGAQVAFMAPEMLAHDQPLERASDVWSIGVIAYILLSGKYPFGQADTKSTLEMQRSILSKLTDTADLTDDEDINSRLFDDLVWNDVSDDAKDFISNLLQIDPDDRPTAEEAFRHVWMEHTRQRALSDKCSGAGGSYNRRHTIDHGKEVWQGLKQTARRRKSQPRVLKQAALTFIASQLVLKDEKKYIDEIFQMMDVEADGVLSRDEVRRGYEKIFGRELKDKNLDALFEKVDLNGTGTIDYIAFVIASLNEKQLLHTNKLHQAFAAFDLDNSGFITAANLKPLLQDYVKGKDEAEVVQILESIIAEVDRDGDGQISLEEFVAMMLHTSHGKRRRFRTPVTGSKVPASNAFGSSLSSSGASDNTSTALNAPPDVFASTTSSLTSEQRRDVWESGIQLTFRTEQVIGRRWDQLTQHYAVGEFIQSGSFGSVWFCTHKDSGALRAVKYVKKSKNEEENQLILREFNILKSLDHPNILKMFELFEDDVHYVIVMDACKGGDLCDQLDACGAIGEVGACLILHQVLTCVNYCHHRHIVHCDLKPENILLEENKAINEIKIIDFGLAVNLVGDFERIEGTVRNGRIKEQRGTLRFMAPEVLDYDYGPKCDVWACGVMAFLLLSNEFPFDGKDPSEVKAKISKVAYDFSDPVWNTISEDARGFITSCLSGDEDCRPTAEEALKHPWIQNAREGIAHNFHRRAVADAAEALDNLKNFQARSVLAQAAYTFIASQLLLKEEKAKIDEVFRVIDISCDGKLSKQELRTAYTHIFGVNLSDDEVDQIFERVDMAGTGFIEYSEFVVASLGKNVVTDGNLKKAFQMFDVKNQGYISSASLKRALAALLGDGAVVDDRMVRKIMKEVARDGTDRITYEEFVATMLNLDEVPQPEKKALFNGQLLKGFRQLFAKKTFF